MTDELTRPTKEELVANTRAGLERASRTSPRERIEAMEKAIELRRKGWRMEEIVKEIDRSPNTIRWWKQKYPNFHQRWLDARVNRNTGRFEVCELSFPDFCKKVLGKPLPRHAYPWYEAMMDPAVQTLLVLCPPFHAKSTILSVQWAAWKIACDRTYRVARISQSHNFARKLVRSISVILTDDHLYPAMKPYRPFKVDTALEGEFKDTWQADRFYVLGAGSEFHSPSVEAKGIGTQIYGDRFHEIGLDDIASVKKNSPDVREQHKDIIRQDCYTRIPHDGGKLYVAATRVGHPDLYAELRDEGFFDRVIESKAMDTHGKALWPSAWPVKKLERQRRIVGERLWALQYQQDPSDDKDAPFPREVVEEAKDDSYSIQNGLNLAARLGLVKVMGFDPAISGWCAAVLLGVMTTPPYHRFLLDVWRERDLHSELDAFFWEACRVWRPRRAVIEDNNFQRYFRLQPELLAQIRSLDIHVQPHRTGTNKHDPDLGVASVANLFFDRHMHLPWGSTESAKRMNPFIDELCFWRPYDKDIIQDQVMAFWFAELGCRRMIPEMSNVAIHKRRGRGAMPLRLLRQSWDVQEERYQRTDVPVA